eukprot:scaffold12995_cov92-Isochrysis_galbana.AAC.1
MPPNPLRPTRPHPTPRAFTSSPAPSPRDCGSTSATSAVPTACASGRALSPSENGQRRAGATATTRALADMSIYIFASPPSHEICQGLLAQPLLHVLWLTYPYTSLPPRPRTRFARAFWRNRYYTCFGRLW